MEAVDCTVDAAVDGDGAAAAARCEVAASAGNSRVDPVDAAAATTAGDATCGGDTGELTVSSTIAHSMDEDGEVADATCSEGSRDSAEPASSRNMETNDSIDSMDQSAEGNSNDCESDGDSASEGTCLEAMTPDGQEYYLRLGDTPRRRSALRLSRIIARQQLLRRLAQGR